MCTTSKKHMDVKDAGDDWNVSRKWCSFSSSCIVSRDTWTCSLWTALTQRAGATAENGVKEECLGERRVGLLLVTIGAVWFFAISVLDRIGWYGYDW